MSNFTVTLVLPVEAPDIKTAALTFLDMTRDDEWIVSVENDEQPGVVYMADTGDKGRVVSIRRDPTTGVRKVPDDAA